MRFKIWLLNLQFAETRERRQGSGNDELDPVVAEIPVKVRKFGHKNTKKSVIVNTVANTLLTLTPNFITSLTF